MRICPDHQIQRATTLELVAYVAGTALHCARITGLPCGVERVLREGNGCRCSIVDYCPLRARPIAQFAVHNVWILPMPYGKDGSFRLHAELDPRLRQGCERVCPHANSTKIEALHRLQTVKTDD